MSCLASSTPGAGEEAGSPEENFQFYVGLHQPSDAHHFECCCIHIGRLFGRQKPLGCKRLILDSQAFRILELHGDHQLAPEAYAALAKQIAGLCEEIVVVTQDYPCEQYMFQKRLEHTGKLFTIVEHQALTIERYDLIRAALDETIYLMPVLQGYAPHEYAQHVRDYGARLAKNAWVGVGSVCKRNGSPSKIRDVLYAIWQERPDLKLHGFGLKQTALRWHGGVIRSMLHSADSLAWSLGARKNGRSANDWREAELFDRRVQGEDLSDLPMFRQC